MCPPRWTSRRRRPPGCPPPTPPTGRCPAAWTWVTIMFLGSIVSGAGVIVAQPWVFFVGLAVIVVGAVVGKVMQMMGLGVPSGEPHSSTAVRQEDVAADAVQDAHTD